MQISIAELFVIRFNFFFLLSEDVLMALVLPMVIVICAEVLKYFTH